MEPEFQSGEMLIKQVDKYTGGHWNQTWVTDRGLHIRRRKYEGFVPYTGLSGIISQRVSTESREDKSPTLEFYEGSERISSIGFGLAIADRIKEGALESKLKSLPKGCSSRVLDEGKLLEIVAQNMDTVTKGIFFKKRMKRVAYQGVKAIEGFLGEEVSQLGGKYHSYQYYYDNPEFISKNWIIEISDHDSGPSLTTIHRPDIVFFYADLLFRQYTSSSSYTSGGRYSDGSWSSSSTTYDLLRESSSVTLYTTYGNKKFSPFNMFESLGSQRVKLVEDFLRKASEAAIRR